MYKNQAQQINRFNGFYYNFMTGNENHVANKLLKWIATRVWGGGGRNGKKIGHLSIRQLFINCLKLSLQKFFNSLIAIWFYYSVGFFFKPLSQSLQFSSFTGLIILSYSNVRCESHAFSHW